MCAETITHEGFTPGATLTGAAFCPHALMKHFDYGVLTYGQLLGPH